MEMNFYNDDFEQFLKQKADQSKMYPSEDVWKGINRSLHSRGKWYRLGAFFLLLTALGVVGDNNIIPHGPGAAANKSPNNSSSSIENAANTPTEIAGNNAPGSSRQQAVIVPLNTPKPPVALFNKSNVVPASVLVLNERREKVSPDGSAQPNNESGTIISDYASIDLTDVWKDADATIVDKDLIKTKDQAKIKTPLQSLSNLESPIKLGPLSRKRLSLQIYFSPTISFRRLNDVNPAKNNPQAIPMAANYYDIDRYVNHTPSLGIELGGSLQYAVSRKLSVKAGLQFNYSRYNIKAFDSHDQKAAIALSSSGFNQDTIRSSTSIRNLGGNAPTQLQNQYVEFSLPVGAQFLLINGDKIQVGIAGTVQPTYLLAQNTYLLSTDYVNYAKEPSLIRKWNMNTNAEAFVSYQVGKVRWQLGPQFRYQVFSTYTNRYPIRENLMEYGIKLGVTKTIK